MRPASLLSSCIPIIVLQIYSLLYEKHRSWYSWALTSTTGFIYTFGFIQMVPQLYINYKVRGGGG